MVLRVFLYGDNLIASSGHQFNADASCPCEQVECRNSILEVDVVAEDIEQVFLGKVGGRTCLECVGDVETSPFVYSAYYSHEIKDSMSNGMPLMWLIAEWLNSI